ncbi:toll/interleukin-1 receptor domain-containing protein [Caenimonas sedimenti]|nr:toll/interleukin-1 receptor domain-containing protein [Caenimonas sedimenti]
MNQAALPDTPGKLFISYRRVDAFAVDHLVEALGYAFGDTCVGQDVFDFEPGANFPQEIAEHASGCSLLVVVIGPQWCGDGPGTRMLDPGDWVRQEVEIALQHGRPLLPVLLAGATMPRAEQLPPNMQPLLARNALPLRTGPDAPGDLRRIVAAARPFMPRDWRRLAGEVAFLAAAMAVVGAGGAALGSATGFTDYAPWQWPNVLVGLATSLAVPAAALATHLNRLWAARWRKPVRMYRQPLLLVTAVGGLILLVASTVAHDEDRVIADLYHSLETTRAELPRVTQQLAATRAMPRYARSSHLRLIEQVLAVRKATTLTEDGVNEAVNALSPFHDASDIRQRSWARLMTAEAHSFMDQHDKQLALYEPLAGDERLRPWLRWYAWNEVGRIAYEKGDRARARVAWEAARRHLETRGVLMNLATLDEDEGRWDDVPGRYKRAEEVLADYKRKHQLENLADQEATLQSNWCTMLRRRARVDAAHAAELRVAAAKRCSAAMSRYSPLLDSYWNLARVELDAGNHEAARQALQKAYQKIQDLSKSSPQSLARHGYQTYGDRYTIWLLVAERFLAGKPLAGDAALNAEFQRLVVQLNPSPADAVAALLAQMKARQLTVNDDEGWLAQMRAKAYL